MADIFTRMASVSTRLLRPASSGGFGSGTINLVRFTPGAAPEESWDAPNPPTRVSIPLNANAFGVGKEMIGTEVSPGVSILSSDRRVISAPIPGGYSPEDLLEIDGKPVTIIRYRNIVAAGTKSAIEFIVR